MNAVIDVNPVLCIGVSWRKNTPSCANLLLPIFITAMLAMTARGQESSNAEHRHSAEADGLRIVERFRGALDEDWTWVRENPQGWRLTETGLEILVEPGTMWSKIGDAKNVLLRKLPGNWKSGIDITCDLWHAPKSRWEQANLVWYFDDGHMVKLGLEIENGVPNIIMGRKENNQGKTLAIIPYSEPDVQLRFKVNGDRLVGYFRKPGTDQWTIAAETTLPPSPDDAAAHISLQCYGGEVDSNRWARVGSLTIERAAANHATNWPQFRGPNRDGKSPETGLLKKWPEGGPKLLRTISGFGDGFSSPVIAGGRIYISGKAGDDLKLFCFDLTGTKIWEQTHGPAFLEQHAPHSPYPGSRAAATLDGDMVYLVGGLGRLTAYRTSDGEPIWSVNVVEDLGGRVPPWGYTESVLIDGDKLICTPGSETRGTFAALDKKTGRLIWQSGEVTERAEYGSPILIETDGVRQVVTMSRGGLVAVSPDNGKLLWRYNRVAKMGTPETTTAHGNSPAYFDGFVFEATSYHTRGGCAVALKPTENGVEAELAWEDNKLNCEHGGYVIVDGFIYMSQGVGWSCVELKTGKERWFGRGPGKGSMLYADGMLYCLSEKGRMGLIEAKPEAFHLVSMFELPPGDGPSWTHPVISDGKLYLRWDDNLSVYDIKE